MNRNGDRLIAHVGDTKNNEQSDQANRGRPTGRPYGTSHAFKTSTRA